MSSGTLALVQVAASLIVAVVGGGTLLGLFKVRGERAKINAESEQIRASTRITTLDAADRMEGRLERSEDRAERLQKRIRELEELVETLKDTVETLQDTLTDERRRSQREVRRLTYENEQQQEIIAQFRAAQS